MIPKEMLFYHNDGRFASLKLVIVATGLVWFVTWLVGLIGAFFGLVLDPNFYIFTAVPFTGGTVMRAWQMVAEAKSKAPKKTEQVEKVEPKQATKKPVEKPKPITTKAPVTIQEKFVARAYPEAKKAERITGIDSVFVTAQAAVESAWGKSGIGTNGNNIFGIKAGRSWQGKKILVTTSEYLSDKDRDFPEIISVKWSDTRGKYHYKVKDWFRDYDTMEQAFEDHAKILQQPHFSHAWAQRSDGRRFVEGLQSGKLKYATSDRYADTIKKTMDQVEKIIKDFSL